MTIAMFAKVESEDPEHDGYVVLEIVDLDAFIHAAPDATVCVVDQDNNARTVRKDALSGFLIEGLDTRNGEWPEPHVSHGPPPYDAATATGMYDHD